MTTIDARDAAMIPAERPAFFDGQGLTAGDLAQAQRYHREMRWRHNRALHGWGVAEGLEVTGAKGAIHVSVSPGYALDSLGRELIVAAIKSIPVPALAAGTRILTLSYLDDAGQDVAQGRAGICGDAGAVRRAEGAEVRWRDPADAGEGAYQPGLHVLLAVADIKDCVLASLSLAGRREARAPVAPRICAGATPAGATPWQVWRVLDTGPILGVKTRVDTSAAGFERTPRYQAQLAGERLVPMPAGAAVFDGFARVSEPDSAGFTLRVLLPDSLQLRLFELNPAALIDASIADRLTKLGWHVNWLGIEG